MPHLPFLGDYKHIPKNSDGEQADEYEVMALAKRLGITIEEMKEMSFVSLFNILIASTNTEDERQATQSDIDRMFA